MNAEKESGEHLLSEEKRTDWTTPASFALLERIESVLFIKSAQAYTSEAKQWKMQIIWCTIGFAVYLFCSWLDYHIWMRYGHWPYCGNCLGCSIAGVWQGTGNLRSKSLDRLWFFQGATFGDGKVEATIVMGASVLARSKTGDMKDSVGGIS